MLLSSVWNVLKREMILAKSLRVLYPWFEGDLVVFNVNSNYYLQILQLGCII